MEEPLSVVENATIEPSSIDDGLPLHGVRVVKLSGKAGACGRVLADLDAS